MADRHIARRAIAVGIRDHDTQVIRSIGDKRHRGGLGRVGSIGGEADGSWRRAEHRPSVGHVGLIAVIVAEHIQADRRVRRGIR